MVVLCDGDVVAMNVESKQKVEDRASLRETEWRVRPKERGGAGN